jgi:hypothetical protein
MPFYRRLAAAARGARIVVLGYEPQELLWRYLQEHELANVEMVTTNVANLRFTGTPTLVLVDDEARVRSIWLGKLDPTKEEEVLQSVR